MIMNFFKISQSEEETELNFISIENELTDEELLESMPQYEEEMNSVFDSYDYLLENLSKRISFKLTQVLIREI